MDSLMASASDHVANGGILVALLTLTSPFALLNLAVAGVGIAAMLATAAAFRRVRRKATALTSLRAGGSSGGRTPSTSCAA